MTNMNYEIRAVDWIKAEALGEPGASARAAAAILEVAAKAPRNASPTL